MGARMLPHPPKTNQNHLHYENLHPYLHQRGILPRFMQSVQNQRRSKDCHGKPSRCRTQRVPKGEPARTILPPRRYVNRRWRRGILLYLEHNRGRGVTRCLCHQNRPDFELLWVGGGILHPEQKKPVKRLKINKPTKPLHFIEFMRILQHQSKSSRL